jgi:hypothetical protein
VIEKLGIFLFHSSPYSMGKGGVGDIVGAQSPGNGLHPLEHGY